ncbi:MAG TPA: isoprenylcysteine carboxylmethyltransferase family protein [Terracidiphilus sp.]|jgi:protein-S-isoprenylcysteine O-methyltransferase Ste14|nr:isoprenylcysteine carboxylmethyltransferase family protein [Terracidiphilus sp.]
MTLNVPAVVGYIWMALAAVWFIGLAFTKRTVRSQAMGSRMFHMILVILGYTLLCSDRLRAGWLGLRFLPPSHAAEIVGVALTAAGCLFATWARLTLGSNWSGRATVKANHELIVSGPYAVARHPIYTGLLVASVGTAMAFGEARCLLGLVLIFLGFAVKIGQEERFMQETFPQAYPAYRQRVRALIPGVF